MRTLFLFRLALFVLILCLIWHENNSLQTTEKSKIEFENLKQKAMDVAELRSLKRAYTHKIIQSEKGRFKDY